MLLLCLQCHTHRVAHPCFLLSQCRLSPKFGLGARCLYGRPSFWSLSMACHVSSRELCAVEYESALDDLCGLLFLLCLSCWGLPLDPAECSHGEHATTAPGPWQLGHLTIPFTVPVNALSQQSLWNKWLQSKCTTEALWTNSCRHNEHV